MSAKRILLVSSDLAQAKTVPPAIKGMPLSLAKTLTNADSALRYARVYPPDILMLDDSLEGMTQPEFMSTWRGSLNLRLTPTVMTVAEAGRENLADAVSLGCAGFLVKPYQAVSLRRHMAQALTMLQENEKQRCQIKNSAEMQSKGEFDSAIAELEAAVELTDESEKFFQQGMHALGTGNYVQAVELFLRAVRLNSFYAEAYEALAHCYSSLGNVTQSRYYLKKAAQVHAEFNRREQARKCFVEVLSQDPDAANPFVVLGNKLMRQGDYKGAMAAMESAMDLTPDDPVIIQNLARLYHIFGRRNQAIQLLEGLLAYGGKFPQAMKLLQHIKDTSWATIDVK